MKKEKERQNYFAPTDSFVLPLKSTRFGEATEWTDKPTVKVAVTDDAPAL